MGRQGRLGQRTRAARQHMILEALGVSDERILQGVGDGSAQQSTVHASIMFTEIGLSGILID